MTTTYPLARCWGAPLDGHIVPADSPVTVGIECEELDYAAWSTDPDPVGPAYREVVYRGEKVAVRLVAPPSHADPLAEITEHYDLPSDSRQWMMCWRCYIREDDGATRTHILGGLRLVAWLASPARA